MNSKEQTLDIKAEAKDEESEDFYHTAELTEQQQPQQHQPQQQQQQQAFTTPQQQQPQRARTVPHQSRNMNLNMNQSMPLMPMMDSEISLTVPMSRKNAAIITSTRLKRLKTLSSAKEEQLTGAQTAEKKRIIRLEKNRRAAAMSRKKKKVYIRDLEENSKLMERHLAILKMENDHLRALLAANMQQQAQQAQQMMAAQAQQQQQQQAQQGLVGRSNSQPAPAPTTAPTSAGLQAPPTMPSNPSKRRRLNDGSASMSMSATTSAATTAFTSMATTESASLNTSDNEEMSMDAKDASAAESMMEKQEVGALPPPPPPYPHAMSPAMNPMLHPMAMMQRLRMLPNMFQLPMHPQMPMSPAMNPLMMAQMAATQPMPPTMPTMPQPQPQMHAQQQRPKAEPKCAAEPKLEAVREQKEDSPDNDRLMPMPLPPSVLGADSDTEEFGVLPFLNESIIEEEIDECGRIEGFADADDNGFVI